MFNNKILAISLLIFGVILLTAAILLTVYSYMNKIENNENIIDVGSKDLYLLTIAEKKYGISKVDGTQVVKQEYNMIARIYDTVYLSSDSDSLIFSLKDGKSVSLGKKESELIFAYSKENIVLPYYIFRYGQNEKDSIYRVYREDGTRYGEKDYTTKKEVLEYIGAKQLVDATALPVELQDKYKLASVLDYKTKNDKIQYIVSKIEDKDSKTAKKGIVDEDGNIILPTEYDKIDIVNNSRKSVRVEKGSVAYIYTQSEKLIEIEPGYDAIMFEQEYYIQKRGSIVNKIFNVNSELVKEGIFDYPGDFMFISSVPNINNTQVIPYLLLKVSDTQYYMYNLLSNSIETVTLNDMVTTYIKNYSQDVIVTSILYKNNNSWYAYNLPDLKSYKITVKSTIESSLDIGVIYRSK